MMDAMVNGGLDATRWGEPAGPPLLVRARMPGEPGGPGRQGSRQRDTELTRDRDRYAGIRCPRCRWTPNASSRWYCYSSPDGPEPPFDACGTCWNTFDTRGRCPGCSHQWIWTTCLSCHVSSRHEEWYHRDEE